MPIQLTPEQEELLTRMVREGAFTTAEQALDVVIRRASELAEAEFQGSPQELEMLLIAGLESGASVSADEQFWLDLEAETNQLLTLSAEAPSPK